MARPWYAACPSRSARLNARLSECFLILSLVDRITESLPTPFFVAEATASSVGASLETLTPAKGSLLPIELSPYSPRTWDRDEQAAVVASFSTGTEKPKPASRGSVRRNLSLVCSMFSNQQGKKAVSVLLG